MQVMNKIFLKLAIRLRNYTDNGGFFKDELKRSILTFILGLISSSVCVIILITHLYVNSPIRFYITFFCFIVLLLALFLIWFRKLGLGKILMIMAVSLSITVNASIAGSSNGENFIWFPLVAAIFIGFNLQEKAKIAFCLFFVFVCIFFLEATNYSFLLDKTIHESAEQVYFRRIFTFSFSIITVIIYVYLLTRFNQRTKFKLHKVNLRLKKNILELKKKNQELDGFVSRAAHDLKAPLSSILGLVTLIKSTYSVEEINQYVTLQEKIVVKMNLFISEMLDLSLNDRTDLTPQKLNFNQILNDIFSQLNFMEESSRIIKLTNISEKGNFYSDPKRIEIILSNLLSNGIRYFDSNKKYNYIDIKIDVNDEVAKINIKDNGLGIEAEFIPRVFEMFFRINNAKKGSGFGLYIVKETVTKLKGKIELTSEIGQWTNFEITIPNLIYLKKE
jgi:signal transduction histidine kinase